MYVHKNILLYIYIYILYMGVSRLLCAPIIDPWTERHNPFLEQTATSSLRESDLFRGHEDTSSSLKINENGSDRPKLFQNASTCFEIIEKLCTSNNIHKKIWNRFCKHPRMDLLNMFGNVQKCLESDFGNFRKRIGSKMLETVHYDRVG